MSVDSVPFVDLVAPHRELREELRAVFEEVLDTAHFAGGPLVEAFEQDFGAVSGSRFCVAVGNGTDALRFALIAAGVQPGDTVVTVPLTFIATTEAISQAGGRFDLVDIDEPTYTMDPAKLRTYFERQCRRDRRTGRLVSRRTGSPVTAIVPVHLYGQMADLDPIIELAAEHEVVVVEDACQAQGAEYFSKRDGAFGTPDASTVSPDTHLRGRGSEG